MVEPIPRDDVATYEIRFRGEIPPSMRERLSKVTIHHSPTETVLYREVTDVAELDLLLDQLQSMGLVAVGVAGVARAPQRRIGRAQRGRRR